MEPHEIPPILESRLLSGYGDAGRAWLEGFPKLLDRFRQQWGVVHLGPHFPYVGFAWVAPCVLADGTHAVLKLSVPDKEFANEIAALRLYAGNGAARLLAADDTAVALLLERLEPGATLASLHDDFAATRIAAEIAGRLFRPLPEGHSFPTVERWGAAFKRVRERFNGGCGDFPADLFEPADHLYDELAASQGERVLLHGDLHHFNILSAGGGWRAIDPKGLAGEREYEVGPFLYNETAGVEDLRRYTLRRIETFAGTLGLDRKRLIGWGFACSVLSRLWTFEDTGEVEEDHLAVARALLPEI